MPGMDGLQATRAIRQLDDPKKASIPIVAMTAHALKRDRQRCLESGMDGYTGEADRCGDAHQPCGNDRTACFEPAVRHFLRPRKFFHVIFHDSEWRSADHQRQYGTEPDGRQSGASRGHGDVLYRGQCPAVRSARGRNRPYRRGAGRPLRSQPQGTCIQLRCRDAGSSSVSRRSGPHNGTTSRPPARCSVPCGLRSEWCPKHLSTTSLATTIRRQSSERQTDASLQRTQYEMLSCDSLSMNRNSSVLRTPAPFGTSSTPCQLFRTRELLTANA